MKQLNLLPRGLLLRVLIFIIVIIIFSVMFIMRITAVVILVHLQFLGFCFDVFQFFCRGIGILLLFLCLQESPGISQCLSPMRILAATATRDHDSDQHDDEQTQHSDGDSKDEHRVSEVPRCISTKIPNVRMGWCRCWRWLEARGGRDILLISES